MRERVAGYITKQKSGPAPEKLNVVPGESEYRASLLKNGDEHRGRTPMGEYNEVFPAGTIGSSEGEDKMNQPDPSVYTAPFVEGEARIGTQHLHGAVEVVGPSSGTGRGTPQLRTYNEFIPRVANMPRAAQDQTYLDAYASLNADPLMIESEANEMFPGPSVPNNRRFDLYGPNKDGMLKVKP